MDRQTEKYLDESFNLWTDDDEKEAERIWKKNENLGMHRRMGTF